MRLLRQITDGDKPRPIDRCCDVGLVCKASLLIFIHFGDVRRVWQVAHRVGHDTVPLSARLPLVWQKIQRTNVRLHVVVSNKHPLSASFYEVKLST